MAEFVTYFGYKENIKRDKTVLPKGAFLFEQDTFALKISDGVTPVNSLNYLPYSLIKNSDILLWNKTARDLVNFSYVEVDPIFTSSPAHSITNSNITNWNTAFSWGNHATVGYITGTVLTTALNNKVDKITGKDLSTEDYTTAEKTKLAGIAAGAQVNVNADWNSVSGDSLILNKPTIPAAQVNSDWNSISGVSQILNKPTIITDHTALTNIGINTHAQIDSHIANTSNPHNVTKTQVGLGNVDNTADATKNVLSATKLTTARTINGQLFDGTADITISATDSSKEPIIIAGTTSQYWRGDKSWQTLDKTAVGLSNVDNTSDINKPISTLVQTALNGKANSAHTHTVSDLSDASANAKSLLQAADYGAMKVLLALNNIDNTSDLNKPISNAQSIINNTITKKSFAIAMAAAL